MILLDLFNLIPTKWYQSTNDKRIKYSIVLHLRINFIFVKIYQNSVLFINKTDYLI